MIDQSHDEQRLFELYLLGKLTEEDRERLQQRYFADAALFSRLLSAETDLVDEYQRGELSAEDRERFEQRFGKVDGIVQRVKFASILNAAVQEQSSGDQAELSTQRDQSGFARLLTSLRSTPARASLLAAATVILLVAGFAINRWLSASRNVTQPELAGSQANQSVGPPNSTAQADTHSPSNTASGPTISEPKDKQEGSASRSALASVSLVLRGGVTRDKGSAPQVVLSPATKLVRTRVELPYELQTNAYSDYQVVLQTVSGQDVFRRDNLRISKNNIHSVSFDIRAGLLVHTDYVVLLSGHRSDGTAQYLRGYSFRVVRK